MLTGCGTESDTIQQNELPYKKIVYHFYCELKIIVDNYCYPPKEQTIISQAPLCGGLQQGVRAHHEAAAEYQWAWTGDHRREDQEFEDYTPFLLCLQRKKAQFREAQLKGFKELKTQANRWVEHMKSIEAEVAKTLCQPREVCIQVSTEHTVSTSTFYVPKCVSVHRCGGCCSGEGRSCVSTRQESISKTLIELTIPPLREPMPVSLHFVNHTGCKCSSSLNPRRSINRRASKDLLARPSNWSTAGLQKTSSVWCRKTQVSCSSRSSWDPIHCRCVDDQKTLKLRGNAKKVGVCGVDRVFSEDSCSCVCKPDHTRAKCGPHSVFSEDSCRCVCQNSLNGLTCGPHMVFSKDSCHCVCKNGLNSSSCGPHQVFNEDSCRCACKNNQDRLSCGPHKLFSEDSCHCVCKNSMDGLRCGPHRVFSEDSCQCVCKNSINSQICGHHKVLENSTCACVCPKPTLRNSCNPKWDWDTEKCRCVCRKTCPKHTSLNEGTCQCECQGAGCALRGMMFNPPSCSCSRLPSPQCPSDYYSSDSAAACRTS